MKFDLLNTDGHARRGRLTFARGVIETPIFMPVGTHWAENRGVNDVFIVCIDGLSGFPDAIAAAFPKSSVSSIWCAICLLYTSPSPRD